jgi:hypothetical protein
VRVREQLKGALFLLEFEFSELTLELTVSQDVSRLISDRLKVSSNSRILLRQRVFGMFGLVKVFGNGGQGLVRRQLQVVEQSLQLLIDGLLRLSIARSKQSGPVGSPGKWRRSRPSNYRADP